MTARLDALLRALWHPHAVGRSPLTWPRMLVHHETRRVLPAVSKTEAARLESEAARQRAEAFTLLCTAWRIGQPLCWTGPRRVFICEDDQPVRAQRGAAA